MLILSIHPSAIALISISVLFQIFLGSDLSKSEFYAYAETDLSSIEMQIQKVEVEPISNHGVKHLIKLSVFFQNNGESRYMMGSEHVMLIFAEPNTIPQDLAPDHEDKTIESHKPTSHLKLENKYPNFASSNDCKRINLHVPTQESKRGIFCFESSDNTSTIEDSISNEQYFLKIESTPHGSSCPNCTVMSLNNVIPLDASVDEKSLKGFNTDEYVKKELFVEQRCSDGTLEIQITNQEEDPVSGTYLISTSGRDVYARTNEDGIATIPDSKQGRLMKVTGGTYVPVLIQAESCAKGASGSTNESEQLQVQSDNRSIPKWIHKNAKWWAEGQIDDSAFVLGIQYMIKEGILEMSETNTTAHDVTKEIPKWIKSNTDWWSKGMISDEDFLKGIQHMVKNGIIKIS